MNLISNYQANDGEDSDEKEQGDMPEDLTELPPNSDYHHPNSKQQKT